MAHFAQLDDNNIVMNIIVVNNEDIIDENGNESEELGIKVCQNHFPGTRWVQTSWNSKIRGAYASVGDYYNEEYDVFCAPQPYPSWTFNPEYVRWDPPSDMPEIIDGRIISWDEESVSWKIEDITKPDVPNPLIDTHDFVWMGSYWNLTELQLEPESPVGIASTQII